MNERDMRELRDRVKQITMKYAGASEEQAEVILNRVGARLNGYSHAEAVELHPDAPIHDPSQGGTES